MGTLLTTLRIRNLALVEDLTWNLGPGFTAITGETGSGKSIILGALKLLIGERADKSLIRAGADSCTVEACFEVQAPDELNNRLEELGVEPCEENLLLIKRTLTATGTNRQFVNGSTTTLSVLKFLGDSLVDLHGPHDHQSLLSPDLQRTLLDSFGGTQADLNQYTEVFQSKQKVLSELDTLVGDDAAFDRECALLAHQVAEIESAELTENEENELHTRYQVATQGRRLLELVTDILQRLVDSEDAALGKVSDLGRALRELERIDTATISFTETHARAVSELEDLARELQRYVDKIDLEPTHLQKLEDRVNLLESLKRKYGASLAAVIEYGQEASQRYQKLTSRAEERLRLQKQSEELHAKILKIGQLLKEGRESAAPILARKVTDHLADLGMTKAAFTIALSSSPRPTPFGLETIEFLFAPNPGEPPKPLRNIASSGETSRIMLAVKSALAEQDTVALLVFDEIDANVGGEIAHAVGQKMRALGKHHQVLSISHLPQVASKANNHFVVTKSYTENRTISELHPVVGDAREVELARMLGGKTDSSLALARNLLESANTGLPQ